jgi:hypothetical protein
MESAESSSASELRETASELVARAKSMGADREAALILLTADELVTLACELECRSIGVE